MRASTKEPAGTTEMFPLEFARTALCLWNILLLCFCLGLLSFPQHYKNPMGSSHCYELHHVSLERPQCHKMREWPQCGSILIHLARGGQQGPRGSSGPQTKTSHWRQRAVGALTVPFMPFCEASWRRSSCNKSWN